MAKDGENIEDSTFYLGSGVRSSREYLKFELIKELRQIYTIYKEYMFNSNYTNEMPPYKFMTAVNIFFKENRSLIENHYKKEPERYTELLRLANSERVKDVEIALTIIENIMYVKGVTKIDDKQIIDSTMIEKVNEHEGL